MRCGAWRAWTRWSYETHCGDLHDLVCDYCHLDAHSQGRLAIDNDLQELAGLHEPGDDDVTTNHEHVPIPFLRELLEDELRRIGAGERQEELRSLIAARESELADDYHLDRLFDKFIASLPVSDRPQLRPQERRLYGEWEDGIKRRLESWKEELTRLEDQAIDKILVVNNARDRLIRLFEAEAREMALLATEALQGQATGNWMTISRLVAWSHEIPVAGRSVWPDCLRDPRGSEIPITGWANLLSETAEWMIRERLLTEDECPVVVGNMTRRYLIHSTPVHPSGRKSKASRKLSNGLYIELQWGPKDIARRCEELLIHFNQDPEQFYVLLNM